METAILVLILFFLLILLGVPIGYGMLITAVFTIKVLHPQLPLVIIPQRVFSGINNFILLCIPFFILAGEIMALTPLFDRLMQLSRALVGRIPGALSHVNIVVSMFFAGITGAATADTSSIGGILIPAMRKDGYKDGYTVAVTVSSSTIGVIIPPSNLMVVAALACGTSVAALFIGGIIPGILSGLSQLVVSFIYAFRYGFPKAPPMTWKERLIAIVKSAPATGMPIIIVGGILGGVFTPTEASAVSVLYAFVVGGLMMRKLPEFKALKNCFLTVAARLGAVMFCVGASMVLGWIFAKADVPNAVGRFIISITTNPLLIIFGFLVTYLIVGCFLDPLPAILIFTPIFLPLARSIGMSVIHFAVVMVFGLAIGLITPPVGSCLYVGAAISGLKIEDFAKDLIPFILAITMVLFLIAYIPSLVTYLPDLLLRH